MTSELGVLINGQICYVLGGLNRISKGGPFGCYLPGKLTLSPANPSEDYGAWSDWRVGEAVVLGILLHEEYEDLRGYGKPTTGVL